MGSLEQARTKRVEAWLAQGGQVLASSVRATRSIAAAYHAARRAEGRLGWATPAVFAWDEWARERWLERNRTGLMLLNPLQEQALWAQVIRNGPAVEGLQRVDRLAQSAQQAYALLARHAPAALASAGRLGWTGDSGIFSDWLLEFDSRCRRERVVSCSRLPLLLAETLENEPGPRAPLLLLGFDRLQESQRAVLDTWGEWHLDGSEADAEIEGNPSSASVRFFATQDAAQEVGACVRWLQAKLQTKPGARLMVVTTNLQARRGELERAFSDASSSTNEHEHDFEGRLDVEFSLGVSLGSVGVARSALLLLRWIIEPLTEAEADWLITSGHCAASADEEIALAQTMLALRSRGLERPEWPLEIFCTPALAKFAPPASWAERMLAARQMLNQAPERQSPLEWVALAQRLLEFTGWPGFRPESSLSYQARQRWDEVLEECGSLGFNGATMRWAEFVSALAGAVSGAIFAAESTGTPIQITEPLPSAGQVADGIWFLGAHEEEWLGCGQPDPLLPVALQRQAAMPHASHLADWEVARQATARLLASAEEVVFSYARQAGEVETRASRLVVQLAGTPVDLPEELAQPKRRNLPCVEIYDDASRIPFPHGVSAGGSATLTRQSLCAFQAFTTARLGSCEWEPAEAGLNAKQRGQLLHEVLHRVWGGKMRGGISTYADLEEKSRSGDLTRFVRGVADAVMRESFAPGARNPLPARFPARLLELEAWRLTRLVSEWLVYELQRLPFSVAATERQTEVTIAGLTLRVRLDRVDRLEDGSELVIDYKSSDVGPSAWRGERPDDVQLPLYAAFAVDERLEGLVIAQVRPGESKFCGRVRDAARSLLPAVGARNGLVKDPLTDDQLEEWRAIIERLGSDFLSGKAEVDPKDAAKTCERCSLHSVCRIYENQTLAAVLGSDEDEAADEPEAGGGSNA